MHENQRVIEMADEVLARQAKARAKHTEEPFEMALMAVRETEAGQQLAELRDGPNCDERAKRWQEDLPRGRTRERGQPHQEAGLGRTLAGSAGLPEAGAKKMSSTAGILRAEHF
jgi:hypothetical protein